MKEYSSSSERLASWFWESRERWKERALDKQNKLRAAGVKIRDLERSRENWRRKAKEVEKKLKQIEQEQQLVPKKGSC